VARARAGRNGRRGAGMRKLLQLIFGDLRNVVSVAVALLAAYGVARLAPAAAGATLALLLIAGAALQAHQK
jgi:hypothetical protein